MQTLQPPVAPSFDRQDWLSGYRSQPEEYAYWIDDIVGEIPVALEGTLFRNGPGLLDIHGYPVQHPFDGDGMINSIAIRQGRAFYRNRFVRTAGYEAEQAAQRPLYRGVFGTQKPGGLLANAFDLKLKNIANTHVISWGGKLLALWEAAEPHRLDPQTLETLGLDYLDGVLQPGDAFAAHPRIDPSGPDGQPRLVNFSVKAGLSSTITLYEFDLLGRLVHRHAHTIPGFAFLHDFAITPNYCIFFQNPVSFNPLPYALGLKGAAACIDFNSKQPTRAIVIPRNGQDALQFVDLPACFVFHHANAFEAEGRVYLDSICYPSFPTLQGGDSYQTVDFQQVPAGQLWRFELNLSQDSATASCLIERCCEFPQVHPDYVGRPYRYLYLGAAHAPQGNAPLQALLKRDLHTGEEQVWSQAPRGFMGEPIFVPHPQGGAEDHGWVLMLLYDAERRCSELAILEAQAITQGPVARLRLHHHIPYGLHGSFTNQYWGPVQ
jgi:all-trans-8'-apo-beta-carotenal 15,15'-oxygenase